MSRKTKVSKEKLDSYELEVLAVVEEMASLSVRHPISNRNRLQHIHDDNVFSAGQCSCMT